MTHFKTNEVDGFMNFCTERKHNLYSSFLTTKNLTPSKEKSISRFLKYLSKLIYLIRKQNLSIDSLKAEENNTDVSLVQVYQLISDSIKKNQKLVRTNGLLVDKLISLIKKGHVRLVIKFFELNGFELVLKALDSLKSKWRHHEIHAKLIELFKCLLEDEIGKVLIMNHDRAVNVLVQCLFNSAYEVKTKCLETLNFIAVLSDTNIKWLQKLLSAFDFYSKSVNETRRFQVWF